LRSDLREASNAAFFSENSKSGVPIVKGVDWTSVSIVGVGNSKRAQFSACVISIISWIEKEAYKYYFLPVPVDFLSVESYAVIFTCFKNLRVLQMRSSVVLLCIFFLTFRPSCSVKFRKAPTKPLPENEKEA
jgi:hypothetical protein